MRAITAGAWGLTQHRIRRGSSSRTSLLNHAWTETADVFHSPSRRGARKACSEFFFEENATAACNCLLHDLRKLVEQPGQRHFQLNMIIGDINRSCGHLTTARTSKRHPVTPRLLLHHEHGKTEVALLGALSRHDLDAVGIGCRD
jgi:hypothetical protein